MQTDGESLQSENIKRTTSQLQTKRIIFGSPFRRVGQTKMKKNLKACYWFARNGKATKRQ